MDISSVKDRNHTVDVLKCMACFMVVLLHYPTREFGSEFVNIQTMLGRCGVPIFFMISGMFAGKRFTAKKETKASNKWFLNQAVKMMGYFVLFSIIMFLFYQIYDLILCSSKPTINPANWFSETNILKFLLANQPFFGGIYWYLLAFAYCLLIYWIASKFKYGLTIIAWLTPVLMVGYYVLGRYSNVIIDGGVPFYYSSNFLFAAIPMFTIGFYLPKMNFKKLTASNTVILIAVSVVLLYCESMALKSVPKMDSGRNNYVFNLVIAFFILYFVSHNPQVNVKGSNILAVIGMKYSLYIYAFQGLANSIWTAMIKSSKGHSIGVYFSTVYNIGKPLVVFLTALAMSIVFCLIVELFKLVYHKTVKKT